MESSLDDLQSKILALLSNGQFISGCEIGNRLSVSRMTVSKHIKQLNMLGLEIFSVKGKGYRLKNPLCLLNVDSVVAHDPSLSQINLSLIPIVNSTNDVLKSQLATAQNGYSVVAECQRQGRGRQGRSWISPYGASLYVSTYWKFQRGYQSISGLSLAIGVAVIRTLHSFAITDVGVKWPNDIYVSGRKISGVLIELEGQFDSDCDCIIGVGINVELPNNVEGITQAWTDIVSETNKVVDRNHLLAIYIRHLLDVLHTFNEGGLGSLLAEWNACNIYQDKMITLLLGTREVEGICRGIDIQGALLLEYGGAIQRFHGGEIRIKHG